MISKIVRGLFLIIGLCAGFLLVVSTMNLKFFEFSEMIPLPNISTFLIFIFSMLFFFLTPLVLRKICQVWCWVEHRMQSMSLHDIIAALIGLTGGLIVALLLSLPLNKIPLVGSYLPLFIHLFMGFLGMRIGLSRRDELLGIFNLRSSFNNHRMNPKDDLSIKLTTFNQDSSGDFYKILDTSAIIDGRISDVWKAGFLEGLIVIPKFVLDELQFIADSTDVLKRNRGRRGLDILNKIQKENNKCLQILDIDFTEHSEVDGKLVELAKKIKGKIITNDYNLNKVAQLQGITALNINELANALKPVVLPGEEMVVQVVRDGKEFGQGVAYLDDGTMIVVDGGRKFVGEEIGVMVTSVLQTAAGRMIFARPKALERAL